MDVHTAGFDQLDAATLYRLLKLRVDVFVVEQRCAYPELDGRDTDPGTMHVWTAWAPDGDPVGYLRILTEADGGTRIGRVAVAPTARGAGVARALMSAALSLIRDRGCVLDAQAHLVDFYRGFGFSEAGPQYVEDGIPHVPMRRAGDG
ncbi:MAG: GNAT family N-acetyltransferase [Jiangellaceae bacterium]|nr:GNAT family N-acetyltransferase [Jiangellaceae bacterium]